MDGNASPPGTSDAPATDLREPSPTLDTDAPAEIDATLLDYLPATVDDVAIAENIDEAAVAIADPTVAQIATAVDVGVALDEPSGNLVTAHVVRIRDGAFDDATYRTWRDTFDAGACAAGGGVKGRAETTIDARTVFITTCVTGLRAYHVWIPDEDVVISAASVGTGDFGRLLMDGLQVP